MPKTMKLTVLVNNNVYLSGLKAEHGWSALIETTEGLILFDLGQSDLYQKNAAALRYDLGKVDKAVLSHGHYDHTGGLNSFLSLNPGAVIYAHPGVFNKRYSVNPTIIKDVSIPDGALNYQDNFSLNANPSQIFSDVFLTGEIGRKYDTREINKGLYYDPEGRKSDYVLDDQAMFVNTSQGIVVLLGCCHSGLGNTLEAVADITGEKKFYMVLGGMHLSNASEDMLRETVESLHRFHVQKVGHAHCSGWRGMEALKTRFSGEVFSCDVGKVIEI